MQVNNDLCLGIRIGMMRSAALIEANSKAGKKSSHAALIRQAATHEDMKLQDIKEKWGLV